MIKIEENRCKGCWICVEFCPKDCLCPSDKINNGGFKVISVCNENDCIKCGNCELMCPEVAISIE